MPVPRTLRRLLDETLAWLAARYYFFAMRLFVVARRTVDGVPIRVPLVGGVGRENFEISSPDRAMAAVLRTALALREGAVVDVGCNIGHFLELCIIVDRRRPYVGFDVSVPCCYYVERFIRENGLRNHSVFPVGLSRETQVVAALSEGEFDSCTSLTADAHAAGRFTQRRPVLTVPGDAIIPQVVSGRVAVVKVDVEGFEATVLEGLAATIQRDRPILIFEVFIYAHLQDQLAALTGAERAQLEAAVGYRREHAQALERSLSGWKYTTFKILNSGELQRLATIDPGAARDRSEMDHVAVPDELLADFLSVASRSGLRPAAALAPMP